jgi:hypothetical protein
MFDDQERDQDRGRNVPSVCSSPACCSAARSWEPPHSCVTQTPHGTMGAFSNSAKVVLGQPVRADHIHRPSPRAVAETFAGAVGDRMRNALSGNCAIRFQLVYDEKKAGSAAVGCRCHTCLTRKC